MLGLSFSSKLDWGSFIISFAKTVSKKIGTLIPFMKFIHLESLCITIYLPYGLDEILLSCLTGAPNCYLEMLDKVHKSMCRTVDPSLSAFFESSAHRQNVASLYLFGHFMKSETRPVRTKVN